MYSCTHLHQQAVKSFSAKNCKIFYETKLKFFLSSSSGLRLMATQMEAIFDVMLHTLDAVRGTESQLLS